MIYKYIYFRLLKYHRDFSYNSVLNASLSLKLLTSSRWNIQAKVWQEPAVTSQVGHPVLEGGETVGKETCQFQAAYSNGK